LNRIVKTSIGHRKARTLVLLFILVHLAFVTGCQTAAQRKANWLQAEREVLKQRDKVCYQDIKYKYQKEKDVLHYMEPWLDTDTDYGATKGFFDGGGKIPTDYEVKIIVGIYNDIAHCRAQMIEGVQRIDPNMVPVYIQSYRASDLSMNELIERKISWNEAYERKLAVDSETDQKIRAEILRLEKEVELNNTAELANQRMESQAGSASILKSQQNALEDKLRQQQVMKPVTTNCVNRNGNMVCTSF